MRYYFIKNASFVIDTLTHIRFGSCSLSNRLVPPPAAAQTLMRLSGRSPPCPLLFLNS